MTQKLITYCQILAIPLLAMKSALEILLTFCNRKLDGARWKELAAPAAG
jgi:hypothetical protein